MLDEICHKAIVLCFWSLESCSVGTFIYTIVVYPLELIVELLFVFFYKSFENLGLSIAAISIIVNIFALPLYHIADKLQRIERDERIRMKPYIDRIKAAFKGDEQYLILSTFYRQNHYHPAYTLRSSVSLMIQVPFFIAAYHFLSTLPQLQGRSFFLINDLGKPDGLLSLGNMTFNLLPILMTLINIIAGAIYTKGFPLRDKLQLYGMAGLFLVLLYQSPAGLVYYWTLNNIFSLVKNLFYKLKHPLKVLYALASIGVISISAAIMIAHPSLSSANRLVLLGGCLFICLLPLIIRLGNLLYVRYLEDFTHDSKEVSKVFIISCLLLWFLSGIVVPANLIFSSPIEFSFTGNVENPMEYVYNTATIFLGLWVIWPILIFVMANKKSKAIISFVFCILSTSALLNLFVFKGNYGTVSKLLQFDNPSLLDASPALTIVPFMAIIFLCLLYFFLLRKGKSKYLSALLSILVLTSGISGLYSSWGITKEFTNHKHNILETQNGLNQNGEGKPIVHLSKEGQNVFVLFLDRAISSFFPYILDQFPELKESFSGFIYYPDSVAYGPNTLTGAPALMGGYEYTPENIDKRDTEKLVDKHNEASLVLPKIFLDAQYDVTVIDPPFSNYKWSADYTPFKKYPEIRTFQLEGKYSVQYKKEHSENLSWDKAFESDTIKQKLPLFSILKIGLPMVRKTIYDSGKYFLMAENPQNTDEFVDAYALLNYLDKIVAYDGTRNTYTFMVNDSAHEPIFLQSPEYEPRNPVTDTYTPLDDLGGFPDYTRMSYHSNAAAIIKIGKWLDILKRDGMYDNTRIIIVSDHGKDVLTPAFKDFEKNSAVLGAYNPLLLYKDFNSKGTIIVDGSLMTNADTPALAIKNLDVSEVNPFTGENILEMTNKAEMNCYYGVWDPKKNLGTRFTYNLEKSFSVHDSIFEESNWTPILDTSK